MQHRQILSATVGSSTHTLFARGKETKSASFPVVMNDCERSPAGLLCDSGLQHPHLFRALLLLVVRAAGLAPRVVLVRVAVVDVELVQHLGHAAQPAAQKFASV